MSPLLTPEYAYPSFFITVFLSIATTGMLLLYALWNAIPTIQWDTGKLLATSWRQSIFLAVITVLFVGLHLTSLLNFWVAGLIVLVFVLIETAMHL